MQFVLYNNKTHQYLTWIYHVSYSTDVTWSAYNFRKGQYCITPYLGDALLLNNKEEALYLKKGLIDHCSCSSIIGMDKYSEYWEVYDARISRITETNQSEIYNRKTTILSILKANKIFFNCLNIRNKKLKQVEIKVGLKFRHKVLPGLFTITSIEDDTSTIIATKNLDLDYPSVDNTTKFDTVYLKTFFEHGVCYPCEK